MAYKLLIATGNKGKFQEISEVLNSLPIQLLSLSEILKDIKQPSEDGHSYADNAFIKANFYHQLSGLPSVADDSGIMVEALKNELGMHTRRWGAGEKASDKEWIDYFLNRMQKEKNKKACFTCVLTFIDKNGRSYRFEGNCRGTITKDLEAGYLPGLPISACFKPDGFDQVFSALAIENKNKISHRGTAARSLFKFLEKELKNVL